MKLELKYLAPYLPYGLKMAHFDSQFKNGFEVHTLNGLSENYRYREEDLDDDDDKELLIIKEITFWFNRSGLNSTAHNVKPILRPLSDLTKEISNGVGLFYPYKELNLCYSDVTDFLNKDLWIGQWWDYEKVSKLFEWHFDVFELIEQGLAVDFNTLEIGI